MANPMKYFTNILSKMKNKETEESKNILKPVKNSTSDINILLFGESGVGKSAFINSFANYLTYTSLEEAERNELICLIPTSFHVIDKNDEDKTVTFGGDRYQDLKLGNSTTKDAMAYKFPYKNGSKIRLIDTPGIGDSDGKNNDYSNFENIISYINQFKKLHGIWILLRPDQKILNEFYKYCFFYLFSRLHKSAALNISFIFTHSRGTHFKPVDTLPLLRRLLSEIKDNPPNVEIPCSKNNMFCLDNEGFQYLVAVNQGVEYDSDEEDDFKKSFKKSSEACFKLLDYVSGLPPHEIKKTSSINEARNLIENLTKPLLKVIDKICKQKITLENRKKIIMDKNMSLTRLQEELKKLKDDTKNNRLTIPIIVCTESTCSEEYTHEGVTRYLYKKACAIPWYINVILPFVELEVLCDCYLENLFEIWFSLFGQAVGKAGAHIGYFLDKTFFETCSDCKCPYLKHKFVDYHPDLIKSVKNEEVVNKGIKSEKETIEEQAKSIEDLQVIISEHEEERKMIINSLAKFDIFLEKNSSYHNSSHIDYIDEFIKNCSSDSGEENDLEKINQYKNLKKECEELKADPAIIAVTLSPEDIIKIAKELRTQLKHSGIFIKFFQRQEEILQRNSNSRHFMEYCFD